MNHDTLLLSSASDLPFARPASAAPRREPAPLARLCARIDGALRGGADAPLTAAFARDLRAALAEAAAAPALLTPAQREGSANTYRRHLLAADPLGRYAVVSLVWQPGQWSPVHGHQTWCGYAVLEGTLSESVYDWHDAAGCATEARRHPRETGAVSYVRAGMTGIHRLGHGGAAADAPAVSLHVYGVPGERIATHVNEIVEVRAGA
ncbi:cysteine dioxygenase family protein [Burkholderia alba]|uniref:cysteine dioxygenase family protein n=1 Tax=Burkholderia alba TaxID=2683677 RepID=UPI002B05697F|nr:cysteine dioxygenase family protein [Burkholderia alba]